MSITPSRHRTFCLQAVVMFMKCVMGHEYDGCPYKIASEDFSINNVLSASL